MKSMTGFGRAVSTLAGQSLAVQVSSVNRKTLDLTVSIPEEWEPLEPVVGELVRKFAVRGKVHVSIELTGDTESQGAAWDESAASATLDRLATFAASRNIPFEPTPDVLWNIVNSQRRGNAVPVLDEARATIVATLEAALKSFAEMREREGAALLADFTARVNTLQSHVSTISLRAPAVPKNYGEQLLLRLRQAGLELNLDDERVLKEIALFADRCDVSEELTRLGSHLEQFTGLLKGNAEIGRKAEFILQEVGREVHTIGSKANDLTLSREVIELKNELERIREQIANVE